MSSPTCPVCESTAIWGNEVRGVYDGVLYWECTVCGHLFPRFLEGRLHDKGIEYINKRKEAQI